MEDSPGLAILVTCTYKRAMDLKSLPETAEDANEMRETFNYFNYIIHELENPTNSEIKGLLNEISDYLKTYNGPVENKVIMFAFSGHGCRGGRYGKICPNGGGQLDVDEEVLFPLTTPATVFQIPKLFFIDACRGSQTLAVEEGGAVAASQSDTTISSKSEGLVTDKGYLHAEGNWWLETATIPEHKSYAFTGRRSVWMPKLARALREQNDSFQNIMDKVKTDVVDELKKLGREMKVGRSIGSLLTGGGLFLQKQPIKTRK